MNVRLQYDDGRDVPVDCVHVGLDEKGCQVWKVVNRPPGRVVGGSIGVLPAKTAVVIPDGE